MSKLVLYGPFSQLLTMNGLPLHGSLKDEELSILQNKAIAVEGGLIKEFGAIDILRSKYPNAHWVEPETQNQVVIPGLVDCHTHICWGGNRVNDYALRVAGKSYLEIAKSGGGIMDTVQQTRQATEEELIEGMLGRLKLHLKRGITTVEVKSGYGLNLKDELKMLRCIKKANQKTPIELVPTFLGAHIKPKDFDGSHSEYLSFLLREVVPIIQKEELAERADIFVEEGAFGIKEARSYTQELKKIGFEMTMHVDQFHSGGSKIAIESECVSADHLEYTEAAAASLFANSSTVAVALPGASLGLGMKFTPARLLLDHNASLAIATDWNPGSAPMGDLITQASILGASEKLTIAETLAAITIRSGYALRKEVGSIKIGQKALFNIFDSNDYRNIFYTQGQLKPTATVIENEILTHEH